MNMFAKNEAATVEQYLSQVPEHQKKEIGFFHDFICITVPNLPPYFAANMIGYGSFRYLDSKKQIRVWPIIALANQKNYISIYVCAIDGEQYVAEKYAKQLGKVSVGRSCIRFRKIEDVNVDTLARVLQTAEKNPGMIGAAIV
ncbi:DUF1801 domain-containing protein [Rhodocytophaga rosea]|uniref:DUF1801 domain-containing protein n=1 Tax=Rhodocytophaga rosea TaxID=2704465 RepID=A0A6C0GU35_9BACT|nr:DUF1801 domain-containing protein [Rhodocytophaga rosea]QHT71708.1 DUF1801 domain-containing protein [Rhodocytophaga rosea]